jgi:hypothetical protein
MINSTVKRLLRHAAEVIAFHQATEDTLSCNGYTIIPQTAYKEESVTIFFKNITQFDHTFLEPLAKYCIAKNLNWYIRTSTDEEMVVEIS